MKKSERIKNASILLLAPVLAFGLFLIKDDLSDLTASVLDISEMTKMQEEGRGVAYKVQDQVVEVFGSEMIMSGDAIEIEVLYNPERVEISTLSLSGAHELLDQKAGLLQLKIPLDQEREVSHELLQIPFSGAADQLLLGEVFLKKGKESVSLSVGNLTINHEHSLLL